VFILKFIDLSVHHNSIVTFLTRDYRTDYISFIPGVVSTVVPLTVLVCCVV
jgi:hypothetical protein